MNFEEAVRKSSVVREQHRETLISDLRDKPDFNWLLTRPNHFDDRLQGDFFTSFPVCFLDREEKPVAKRQAVMVVNNSCDLPPGRSNFVTVAPVFDLARFLEAKAASGKAASVANFEKDLRKNQISELLFIPMLQGFPSGAIVRLDMVCTVASTFLEEAVSKGTRTASFSQSGFYVLLMKLTHHLTRMESYEVSRS